MRNEYWFYNFEIGFEFENFDKEKESFAWKKQLSVNAKMIS